MKVFEKIKTLSLSLFGYELKSEMKISYTKAKFKVGDEVLIESPHALVPEVRESGIPGVILEVNTMPKLRGESPDEFQYLVEYNPLEGRSLGNHRYKRYFTEDKLDYSLQKKRDDKLKQLGI